MMILLLSVFIAFALFCTGRLLRPLMLPLIIIMTVGYVLYWAGTFNTTVEASKSHRHSFQHSTDS